MWSITAQSALVHVGAPSRSDKGVSSSYALEDSGVGEARIVTHTGAVRNDPAAPLERKFFEKRSGELGGNEQAQRWMRYHMSKLANSTFTFALQVCIFTMVNLKMYCCCQLCGFTCPLYGQSTTGMSHWGQRELVVALP
jgi:hypothetical protein